VTTDGGAGILQSTNPGGTSDAYLIYWTESTATLGTVAETWSTYLGGSSIDEGSGVELDGTGNLYVAGHTQSLGPSQVAGTTVAFPAAGGAGVKVTHSVSANAQFDGYEGKFSPTGGRLCLGFFGNSGDDYVKDSGFDDAAGIIYLTGQTLSSNFDIGGTGLGQDGLAAGCGQPARAGAADAYMAKFDANCVLRCATYHGGSEEDIGMDLDVLENSGALGGNTTIIVAGYTFSANMPVSPTANQQGSIAQPLSPSGGAYTAPVSGNSSDFFMICYSPDCCRLWSSYWGGSRSDEAHGVSAFTTANGIDRMVVGGVTFSVSGGGETAYPVSNATGSNYFQGAMTVNGEPDAALLVFDFFRDEKLSIDLTSFGASVNERNVNLKWRTASEDHNAGFEVRRAELLTPYDKVNFKAIGNYLTNTDLIGLGSSPVGKEYIYVDNDPSLVAGRTYIYQLVDIANDGVRTEHPSVSVQLDAGTITPVYEFKVDPVKPNPTSGSMQLAFSLREDSKVTVEIYGADGKKIATAIDGENFTAGDHTHAFDVKHLVPGVYTAVVSTSNYNYVRTRQFVVVK
jgi:hypothetical protein